MLHGQRIIYVSIVDNQSKTHSGLRSRIWTHEKQVRKILSRNSVVIGRKTLELTNWKGKNTWVLTRKKNYKAEGIGIIHDIDDIHLHIEGPIYILGGTSLFLQFEDYVDEVHLYVINDKEGKEPWIKMKMSEWKAFDYINENAWSYAHLIKRQKDDKF
jgi:dihydrofolate reductase